MTCSFALQRTPVSAIDKYIRERFVRNIFPLEERRSISVNLVTTVWAGPKKYWSSIPGSGKGCSSSPKIQFSPDGHQSSHLLGSGDFLSSFAVAEF